MKDDIIVYTDGACSGNPGKGGWAALIISQQDEEIISGSEKETTNNRMELMAVIKSLLKIKSNKINIFTDSKYVKNGIEDKIKDEYPDEKIFDNRNTRVELDVTEINLEEYQVILNFKGHKGEIIFDWNVNIDSKKIESNNPISKNIINLVDFYD